MQTTYELHSSELSEQFLASLKQLFADKVIRIVITEMDETDYLLHTSANRDHLLQVVREIESDASLPTL